LDNNGSGVWGTVERDIGVHGLPGARQRDRELRVTIVHCDKP
jgi:hypothetical protein